MHEQDLCIWRTALIRWIVLGAALVIQTCLGAVYAWSAFVPALKRDHGLTGGQAGLVYSAATLTGALLLRTPEPPSAAAQPLVVRSEQCRRPHRLGMAP
jgi:hypothetical protein